MKTLLLILLLVPMMSFGQEIKNEEPEDKAEYVLKLIQTKSVARVEIISETLGTKAYKDSWLSEVSIKGNLLFFKKMDNIHSWDLKYAIFIEKYNHLNKYNILKIYLKKGI